MKKPIKIVFFCIIEDKKGSGAKVSKKTFNKSEIEKLKNNIYVKEASQKGITYTDEFKVLFIAEYKNGKLPREIFKEAGFEIEILGQDRINAASRRWGKAYEQSGELGLRDTRKTNSGRPLMQELTLEKQLARKEAETAYLKAEVELLKKIELQERQVKNDKISSRFIYKIIQSVIRKYDIKRMIQHLCKVTGASRSGYYAYVRNESKREEREIRDKALVEVILKAFDHQGYKKGSRAIKLESMIDDYMNYYNNYRYQWGLKKLTPVQFRNQLFVA